MGESRRKNGKETREGCVHTYDGNPTTESNVVQKALVWIKAHGTRDGNKRDWVYRIAAKRCCYILLIICVRKGSFCMDTAGFTKE